MVKKKGGHVKTDATIRVTALREWELRELQSLYRTVDRLIADLVQMTPYLEPAEETPARSNLEVEK